MSECVECKEVITNPVCSDCVENEITSWLYEVKPELIEELKDKTDEISFNYGTTTCILCNDYMSVCTYCYTGYVFEWLKIKVPHLSKEFRKFFDFNYYFSS